MTQIKCTATNVGPTVFSADVNGFKLLADAPASAGGTGAAMTPPQAQVAVLANCMGLVIAIACGNKGVDYEGMSVEATAMLNSETHCLGEFKVEIHMPGVITDRCRRTVEAAANMCSIGNTICADSSVEVSLVE